MKKLRSLASVLIVLMLILSLTGCGAKNVTFSLYGDDLHGETGHQGYAVWIDAISINIQEGDSALSVIIRGLEKKGYSFADESYIYSVTTPGNMTLEASENGPNSGWLFAVNGVIPEVGMGDYKVKEDDHVILQYVDDFNTEVDWETSTFILDIPKIIAENK